MVIGRAIIAGDIDENGLFLPIPDPLPVGTKVNLKLGDRAVEGRVIGVAESSDPSKCGMSVRIGGASQVPVAAPTAAASSVTAAPLVEPTSPPPAEPVSAPAATPAAAPTVEMAVEGSGGHLDSAGEGVPNVEDPGGPSGGTGGRRKKRRR